MSNHIHVLLSHPRPQSAFLSLFSDQEPIKPLQQLVCVLDEPEIETPSQPGDIKDVDAQEMHSYALRPLRELNLWSHTSRVSNQTDNLADLESRCDIPKDTMAIRDLRWPRYPELPLPTRPQQVCIAGSQALLAQDSAMQRTSGIHPDYSVESKSCASTCLLRRELRFGMGRIVVMSHESCTKRHDCRFGHAAHSSCGVDTVQYISSTLEG